jgi:hypothetical protein
MGWIHGLKVSSQVRFDDTQRSKAAIQSSNKPAIVHLEDQNDLYTAARSPLCLANQRDIPFIDPAEVERHDNVIDGFCECPLEPRAFDFLPSGIVIDNRVYDVTTFLNVHPGGEAFFTDFGGRSCTWQVRDYTGLFTDF